MILTAFDRLYHTGRHCELVVFERGLRCENQEIGKAGLGFSCEEEGSSITMDAASIQG